MMNHQTFDPEFTREWLGDNHRGNNPSIVNSVTNDEDEDGYNWSSDAPGQSIEHPPHRSSTTQSRMDGPKNSHSIKRNIAPVSKSFGTATSLDIVESYLIGYERMVMEQDREKMVTWSHLQPILELLDGLVQPGQGYLRSDYGRKGNHSLPNQHVENHPTNEYTGSRVLSKEYSYENLQRALSIIDDDDSALDFRLVKTDEQFMMVLRLLCEAPWNPKYGPHNPIQNQHKNTKISWAEILQCYRLCIVGMQTLESLETPSLIRARAKERTLRILSMFQPFTNNFVDSPQKGLRPEEKPKWQGEMSTSWYFDDLSPSSNFTNNRDVFKRKGRSMRQGWNVSVRPIVSAVMLTCIIILGMWHIIDPVETPRQPIGANPIISSMVQTETPSVCRDFSYDVTSLPNLARIIKTTEQQPTLAQIEQGHDRSQLLPRGSDVRPNVKVTHGTSRPLASVKSYSSIPVTIRPTHAGNSIHLSLDSTPLFTTLRESIEDNAVRTDEDANEGKQIRFLSSPELGTAGIVAGTATVLYLLLPIFSGGAATAILSWIPTGLTVLFATLFGNDIRVWASRWRKILPRRKGGSPIRMKRTEPPKPIG